MINPIHFIPIAAYAAIALLMLLVARRSGGLQCALIASYCGVIVLTVTRGASGAVFLVQVLLVLLLPVILRRRHVPSLDATPVIKLTYAMFIVFIVGVGVSLARYDPSLEAAKAGAFQSVAGIPLSILMALYRIAVIATLALVFTLPLRYNIDRRMMGRCLCTCWIMSVIIAVATVLHYVGAANLGFALRSDLGGEHSELMGFHRASHGLMLLFGIFLSYAMTQIVRSRTLRALAYASAPLLIVALLFSWSRAAMVGMAAGSLSLIITLGGARALRGVLWSTLGVIVIYTVLINFSDMAERVEFFRTGDTTIVGGARIATWLSLLGYLGSNPDVLLFGTGFQNFHYFLHLGEGAVDLEAAHNGYLHTLTEGGIFGFLIFAAWLAAIVRWLLLWRRRDRDPKRRVMAGVFMSMTIGLLATMLTQETLSPAFAMVPWLLHFYLMLGIWVSWYRCEMHQEREPIAATQPTRPGGLPVTLGPADAVVYY